MGIISASTAQRQNKQVETNKSNQRPPKISEAEQHHQRPQQPQQQHVRFSATSVSASVVTKFRHLRPPPFCQVGKGPKTLSIQDPREIQKLRTCLIPTFAESVRMRNLPVPQGLDQNLPKHKTRATHCIIPMYPTPYVSHDGLNIPPDGKLLKKSMRAES